VKKSITATATVTAAALLGLAASPAAADPAGGPKYASGGLYPNHYIGYDFVLIGSEVTVINVAGSGSGDIDCQLLDQNGNVVVQDYSGSDSCRMFITPRWTGPFRLVLINNGRYPTNYAASVL
jgi:hypothetical protein